MVEGIANCLWPKRGCEAFYFPLYEPDTCRLFQLQQLGSPVKRVVLTGVTANMVEVPANLPVPICLIIYFSTTMVEGIVDCLVLKPRTAVKRLTLSLSSTLTRYLSSISAAAASGVR